MKPSRLYAHVKSQLVYQMGLPASSGVPTPAGPHRYLRLRRVEQDTNQNGAQLFSFGISRQ